jgi:DNA-binding PadR family transcriptional regulator
MKHLTRKEEQILLAIYQIKRDAYLIPIREQVKKYTGTYYSVGTIYAPLNRLHRDGYLESYIKKPKPPNAGKSIKYYKLTNQGFKALAEIKKQNEIMWEGVVIPSAEK